MFQFQAAAGPPTSCYPARRIFPNPAPLLHDLALLPLPAGCGKSTQIPQFLAAAGWRRIAVTQPRRISAVSLARRVAVEACDAHGSSVAFKVRFSSSVSGECVY